MNDYNENGLKCDEEEELKVSFAFLLLCIIDMNWNEPLNHSSFNRPCFQWPCIIFTLGSRGSLLHLYMSHLSTSTTTSTATTYLDRQRGCGHNVLNRRHIPFEEPHSQP